MLKPKIPVKCSVHVVQFMIEKKMTYELKYEICFLSHYIKCMVVFPLQQKVVMTVKPESRDVFGGS